MGLCLGAWIVKSAKENQIPLSQRPGLLPSLRTNAKPFPRMLPRSAPFTAFIPQISNFPRSRVPLQEPGLFAVELLILLPEPFTLKIRADEAVE